MTAAETKDMVADLARPLAIIITAAAGAAATVIVACKLQGDAAAVAIFIGAVNAGTAALYGAKAWEITKAGKHNAEVEIAKAKQEPTT